MGSNVASSKYLETEIAYLQGEMIQGSLRLSYEALNVPISIALHLAYTKLQNKVVNSISQWLV